MRLIFWWLPLFLMAIGAAYAFARAVIDLLDWLDNRAQVRKIGKCARTGCNRAGAVIYNGHTAYCEKHASWIGWETP